MYSADFPINLSGGGFGGGLLSAIPMLKTAAEITETLMNERKKPTFSSTINTPTDPVIKPHVPAARGALKPAPK